MKTKQKFVKTAAVLLLFALFMTVSISQVNSWGRPAGTGADGYVKNSSNNNPISGALVTLKIDGIVQDTDYTDSAGYYKVTIRLLLSGPTSAQLKVEKSGFCAVYEGVTLINFQIVRENIFLDPVPPPPTQNSVTYAGIVLDNFNDYVSQATVKLKENGNIVSTTTADNEGNYAINYDIWTDRDYDLVASKTGYETTTVNVPIIEEGETHYENFYMVKLPPITTVTGIIGYDTGKSGKVAGEDFTITVRRKSDSMVIGTTTTDHWGNYELEIDLTVATTIEVIASNSHLAEYGWSDPYLLEEVYLSPGESTTVSKTFSKYPEHNIQGEAVIYLLQRGQLWDFVFGTQLQVYYEFTIKWYLSPYTDPDVVPMGGPNSFYMMYLEECSVWYANPHLIDPEHVATTQTLFTIAIYEDIDHTTFVMDIFDSVPVDIPYGPNSAQYADVDEYFGFTNGMFEFLFAEPNDMNMEWDAITWMGFALGYDGYAIFEPFYASYTWFWYPGFLIDFTEYY